MPNNEMCIQIICPQVKTIKADLEKNHTIKQIKIVLNSTKITKKVAALINSWKVRDTNATEKKMHHYLRKRNYSLQFH